MTYRKKKEMLYRMIFLDAWSSYLGIKTQTLRDLKIQIAKLRRLTARDDFYYMQRIDSLKRVDKLETKNARQIAPQYDKVLSLVEKVFRAVSDHRGEALTRATLRQRLYGHGGFIEQVEAYGREHAAR